MEQGIFPLTTKQAFLTVYPKMRHFSSKKHPMFQHGARSISEHVLYWNTFYIGTRFLLEHGVANLRVFRLYRHHSGFSLVELIKE